MKGVPFLSRSQGLRFTFQIVSLFIYLYLFLYVCWPYTASPSPDKTLLLSDGRTVPAYYDIDFTEKEIIPAEFFLSLDPLLSITAMIGARTLVPALWGLLAVLFFSLFFPRSFCSYICPLGTVIGGVDHLLGRITRNISLRGSGFGWIRFGVLIAVVPAAGAGVMLAGYVAAIPVFTRAMTFVINPLHLGMAKGWHNVPDFGIGMLFSVLLFGGIFALGIFGPRFWCRYFCPSGGVLSLFSFLRLRTRKVSEKCTSCGKCRKTCSFDAVKDDFSTDISNCTSCGTCRDVCPVQAVGFVFRTAKKTDAGAGTSCTIPITRRNFLGSASTGLVFALGLRIWRNPSENVIIRPPGSIPEEDFLAACIRCGECIRVCPNSVLQPAGLEHGFEPLWTPRAVPDWSGCDPSCNNCGKVCPTGVIRSLPLQEKRAARMGQAEIDPAACLPWSGREECELCAEECQAAGYNAIEFERIGVETDDEGFPVEGTGFRAPVMLVEACVGCGLCQTRCNKINVKTKKLLKKSSIIIKAGNGHEDRMSKGSYLELRRKEHEKRLEESRRLEG